MATEQKIKIDKNMVELALAAVPSIDELFDNGLRITDWTRRLEGGYDVELEEISTGKRRWI